MSGHYDNALHMMQKLGGSFVQALAHCYLVADGSNRQKLLAAFPNYFDIYEYRFKAWQKDDSTESLQETREVKF